MIRPWHLRKQPSIKIAFSAVTAHTAIADFGTVISSPWQPLRYGSFWATRFAALLAISPRMHAPSQEKTGIFFDALFSVPTISPIGQ
jgi:hypothetical protein